MILELYYRKAWERERERGKAREKERVRRRD